MLGLGTDACSWLQLNAPWISSSHESLALRGKRMGLTLDDSTAVFPRTRLNPQRDPSSESGTFSSACPKQAALAASMFGPS
jgi:hypothetical protein